MSKEKTISVLKGFRLEISRIKQIVEGFSINGTIECQRSANALRMAKAWLGYGLGQVGDKNPYLVAQSPSEIPVTAEVYKARTTFSSNHLQAVNETRLEIDVLVEQINDCLANGDTWLGSTDGVIQAIHYLREAKFYLGFELSNIRQASGAEIACCNGSGAHPNSLKDIEGIVPKSVVKSTGLTAKECFELTLGKMKSGYALDYNSRIMFINLLKRTINQLSELEQSAKEYKI